MNWKWLFLSVLLAVAAPAAGPASATTIDGIAATVNGEVITILELENAGKPLVEKKLVTATRRERAKVKREVLRTVLDQLVLRVLQTQRAEKLGLKISEGEVDAAIANIMEKNSLNDQMLARALAEEGLTQEQYRKNISEQILFSRLMQQEVRGRVTVTEEETETYYREHEQDYHDPERIRVRHLLIKVDENASAEDADSARQKALDILGEARGGAEFAYLVSKHSPETFQGEDGVSGWLRRGEFLQELEEVSFSLPPGQISEPIQSRAGFHLIQLVEKQAASQLSLEAVRDTITETLTRSKMESNFNDWLQELKSESQIEILY